MVSEGSRPPCLHLQPVSDARTLGGLVQQARHITEAALDRNIEIGLLVRDRTLAVSVTSHFHTLIDQGLLRPLPSG